MASLRGRLLALWVMLAASGAATSFLLMEFYRQSANAQVGRAEEIVSRACREIGDRYIVLLGGLRGAVVPNATAEFKAELLNVVRAALTHAPGVEGGIWRQDEGSLAYAFPTYEGTGPKTDLPAAELETIQQINADAVRGGLPVTIRQVGRSQVLAVNACPLPGSARGVTAWAMTRVFTGQGPAYNQLLVGLGILALTVLGSAVWLGRILYGWSRKIIGLETALAAHDAQSADLLQQLPLTGERELDRLVHALNATGARLADERRRAGAAERLAAVGRVAAGLAHEIRNPIAAMRLKAENALAVDDKERRASALDFMLQQIGRLDGLLRDLLAMTQRREPKLAENDLTAFLDHTVDAHREFAATKGIKLVVGPAPTAVVPLLFDTEQMYRALDNLILNAIESTPTGGMIEVQSERRNAALAFCVCDTGSGVPHDIRERLFEPFVTGRSEGTGLGLAVVREIARAHGGEARFVPTNEGAKFEIEIPWRTS
jgi:signal transduction histidine kinase